MRGARLRHVGALFLLVIFVTTSTIIVLLILLSTVLIEIMTIMITACIITGMF